MPETNTTNTAFILLQRTLRLLALWILSLGILSACAVATGSLGGGAATWREEVLLHDGQKIIVQRATVRGGRHEIGQRGAYTEQTLSFVQPGTSNTIEWVDHFSQDLGNSSFLPMMLDIKSGTPYLVVSPMGCMAYNKWGRPNPPYVVFQYQGKEWQRIPLEALPADMKTPNLNYSSPDDQAKKTGQAIVSAETIKALYAGYPRPEQRTILREPMANGGSSCRIEFTNGKGRWLSADWFSDETSLASCKRLCGMKQFSDETCPCKQFFKGE